MARNLVSLPLLVAVVTANSLAAAKELTAKAAKIRKYMVVPGTISEDENRTALIDPRYPGLATDVFVATGDHVVAGSPLARVKRNQGLSTYTMRSPISGTVLARHINPGDPLQEGSRGFYVSDLSTVWASLSVKEIDLKHFQVGGKIFIRSRMNQDEIPAQLTFVSPVLDPATRSARAIAVLDNKTRRWLPGMAVDGYLFQETVAVPISLPLEAIQWELGRAFTFRVENRQTIKTYLRLGIQDRKHAEIVDGIGVGAIVTSSPLPSTESDQQLRHLEPEEHSHEGHVH